MTTETSFYEPFLEIPQNSSHIDSSLPFPGREKSDMRDRMQPNKCSADD